MNGGLLNPYQLFISFVCERRVLLIKKKIPDYLEVLSLCAELKVNFYFCNTALEFLNLSKTDLLDYISIQSAPLYQILNKYKDEQTIFI